jgi:hypothetical protein
MKKVVYVFLLATILLQSCYVYQKTPVSITEATNNGRVNMIVKSSRTYELNEIIIDNEEYFGNFNGQLILIEQLTDKQFYLLDVTKTVLANIAATVLAIAFPLLAYAAFGIQ